MKDLLLTLILVLLSIIHVNSNLHQKCCGSGHHVVEKNFKFTCEELPNARLQETFENKDFLAKTRNGSCVEIFSEKKLAIFKVNDIKIEKTEELKDNFFPKCCPLDHRYNTTTHSCQKQKRNELDLLKMNSFIRVGLPNCEIISDKIFNFSDVEKHGKYLNLLKENRIYDDNYCLEATTDEKLVVRVCESDKQICSKIMCIHKCCPDGQSFIDGPTCKDTWTHGIDLKFSPAILAPFDPFILIHGFKPRIHILSLDIYSYQIDRFGVFTAYINQTNSYERDEVFKRGYCIEHTLWTNNQREEKNEYIMFYQEKVPEIEVKFEVTRWIKVASCIFLILTILVYLLLPQMRNLFGKILLNYCVSTLVLFGSLVVSQFYSTDFTDNECTGIGFLSLLSSVCSFTWLHIMCIDIWRSFGTSRKVSGRLQDQEGKSYLVYSLYGWGFPLLWVSMIAIFSLTKIMPQFLHPVVGERKCYLENLDTQPGNYSYIIYMIMPLIVQQIVNTILFVKTILHCLNIKGEIARMNDSERRTALKASKERLGLIVKLAVIMGILFIFETVSSIHNFQNNKFTTLVEVVWDSINCMQGVFIFIIFICKKKVYNSLCDKVSGMKSRKISVSSIASTQVSMQYMNELRVQKELN